MASKKSTNISLSVLGIVSLGVLVYFGWIFLAPSPVTPPVEQTEPAGFETEIITSNGFMILESYADLPIVPSNVGRVNPFEPYASEEDINPGAPLSSEPSAANENDNINQSLNNP